MQTVNTIKNKSEEVKGKPEFIAIIKRDGKVVYRNKAHAGVLNFVEKVEGINKEKGEIMGRTQTFCFGHPALQVFSFDQLHQKIRKIMKKYIIEILEVFGKKPPN